MLYVNPMTGPQGVSMDRFASAGDREELALKEMEHFFGYMLLREMRKTVPVDGLFPQTPAMRMYEDLMDDMMAAQWAETGQMGLADKLAEQLRLGELQHTVRAGMQGGQPLKALETSADKHVERGEA